MRDESLKNTGPMYDATTMFARFRQSRRLTGPAMLSAAGSRAKESAPQTIARLDLLMSDQGFGVRWREPLAQFDHGTLSWKTCLRSLFEDSEPYSEIYARSGLMRNGKLYRQTPLLLLTDENEFSLWPTPQASDAKRMKFSKEAHLKQQARNRRLGFGSGPGSANIVLHCVIEFDGLPTANFC